MAASASDQSAIRAAERLSRKECQFNKKVSSPNESGRDGWGPADAAERARFRGLAPPSAPCRSAGAPLGDAGSGAGRGGRAGEREGDSQANRSLGAQGFGNLESNAHRNSASSMALATQPSGTRPSQARPRRDRCGGRDGDRGGDRGGAQRFAMAAGRLQPLPRELRRCEALRSPRSPTASPGNMNTNGNTSDKLSYVGNAINLWSNIRFITFG